MDKEMYVIVCKAWQSLSILLVLTCAWTVNAHDTWLLPDKYKAPLGNTVMLHLTSGMEFPKLDHAIRQERVHQSHVRIGGAKRQLAQATPEEHSLRYRLEAENGGIASAWITLKPKLIALNDSQVNEYLDEIGASESIRKTWSEMKQPRQWREIYTKHAKTYLIFDLKSDDSWRIHCGQTLEILPRTDPTAIKAGDVLKVTVLKNGSPFPEFVLSALREGEKKAQKLKTDSHGEAQVKCNEAGQWLLRGTDLRLSQQKDVEWESDFCTLTVQVAPK